MHKEVNLREKYHSCLNRNEELRIYSKEKEKIRGEIRKDHSGFKLNQAMISKNHYDIPNYPSCNKFSGT